jgi:GMP synthase (glutamine-hydrolysing)
MALRGRVTLRFLIADCEPAGAREGRRANVGKSAGEAYAALLRDLISDAQTDIALPADAAADPPRVEALRGYDGVILTGSPLHLYEPAAAARREVAFMRDVFRSGTPAFGSCAGLQVAVVAAGGTVRPLPKAHEAGFARRIWPTEQGRAHPLLAGRPPAYDAPALHGDEVDRLPPGALHLAQNQHTRVQAAEIRHEGGVFWGVQYHPELSLHEIAAALRRDADTLVEDGLAPDRDVVESQAELVEALGREPERVDLMWRLGVDRQIASDHLRRTELINFVERLVRPTRDHGRR